MDWRRIGNAAIAHPTGDAATGPVARAWFAEGGKLVVKTASGSTWEATGGSEWRRSTLAPPELRQRESGARLYRIAQDAQRSDDGGKSWINLTSRRGMSILGNNIADLSVSPANPDDIVVATPTGIWRSLDGGETWAGANDSLPNLNLDRLLSTPQGTSGLRAVVGERILEWIPGQRSAWSDQGPSGEQTPVIAQSGAYVYRTSPDGEILVSRDGVAVPATKVDAAVARFWVDPVDGAFALAVAGSKVFRTMNGGLVWDDITGALASGVLHGVTADRQSGAIYAAGERGAFFATLDFDAMGSAPSWRRLAALPEGRVLDVKLDPYANQLYASVEGYGAFGTLAPHRRRLPNLVSAADLSPRAAAPGALMSLLGRGVTAIRSGDRAIPVLAALDDESQVQVPFEAQGNELALRLESASTGWDMRIPLSAASPAIFVDRDGSPMLLDGDSGVLLDAMNPARSRTRLQILATGLGRVKPEWPTGIAAPADNPPAVDANVRVLLDGQPLEVSRATLAPGYVGFYLIEAEMPSLVNAGSAELTMEVAGRPSNRVRVYIRP